MSNFRISKATKADSAIVLDCIKGLASYVNQLDMVTATESALSQTIFSENAFVETYLAYCNEEPVGFVLFYKTYSTFKATPGLYIEDLFVFPQFRGRGFGKRLLDFVIDYARDKKFHKVEWYVNNQNHGAIEFYRKYGAQKLDYKSIFNINV